jgi:hypothetical protein
MAAGETETSISDDVNEVAVIASPRGKPPTASAEETDPDSVVQVPVDVPIVTWPRSRIFACVPLLKIREIGTTKLAVNVPAVDETRVTEYEQPVGAEAESDAETLQLCVAPPTVTVMFEFPVSPNSATLANTWTAPAGGHGNVVSLSRVSTIVVVPSSKASDVLSGTPVHARSPE